LCLLIAFAAARQRPASRPAPRRWWVGAGLAAAGAVLGLMMAADRMIYAVLTHIATAGIDMAHSLGMARYPLERYGPELGRRFFATSLAGYLAVVLAAVLILRVAAAWNGGWKRRLGWGLPAAAALAAGGAYAVWFHRSGFAQIAPWLAEVRQPVPAYRWMAAAVLALVAATAGAYRLAAEPSARGTAPVRHRTPYLHGSRLVAGLVAVVLAAHLLMPVVRYPASGWSYAITGLLWPPTALEALVAVMAGLAAVRGHGAVADPRPAPPAVSPGRFAAVWAAILLWLSVAVPAAAGVGFGVWFAAG
jgi:hypothetical protein